MKKVIILISLCFIIILLVVFFIYSYDPYYTIPSKYSIQSNHISDKDNLYYDLFEVTENFNFPPTKEDKYNIINILKIENIDMAYIKNLLNNYSSIINVFDNIIDKKEIKFPFIFENETKNISFIKIINITKLYLIYCIYDYQIGNKEKCFKNILRSLKFANEIETSDGAFMSLMIGMILKSLIINTSLRLIDDETVKYIDDFKKYFININYNIKKSLKYELNNKIKIFNIVKDDMKIKLILFKYHKSVKITVEIFNYLINSVDKDNIEYTNIKEASETYKNLLPFENFVGKRLILLDFDTLYTHIYKIKDKNFYNISLINVTEAIKLFEKKNNRLPNNLNDLIPLYLDSIPVEKQSRNKMKYSKKERAIYFDKNKKYILK